MQDEVWTLRVTVSILPVTGGTYFSYYVTSYLLDVILRFIFPKLDFFVFQSVDHVFLIPVIHYSFLFYALVWFLYWFWKFIDYQFLRLRVYPNGGCSRIQVVGRLCANSVYFRVFVVRPALKCSPVLYIRFGFGSEVWEFGCRFIPYPHNYIPRVFVKEISRATPKVTKIELPLLKSHLTDILILENTVCHSYCMLIHAVRPVSFCDVLYILNAVRFHWCSFFLALTPQSYEESIPQDLKPDSEVMRISATDIDDGENRLIEYDLSENNSAKFSDRKYFRIDKKTGIIKLNREILDVSISVECSDLLIFLLVWMMASLEVDAEGAGGMDAALMICARFVVDEFEGFMRLDRWCRVTAILNNCINSVCVHAWQSSKWPPFGMVIYW